MAIGLIGNVTFADRFNETGHQQRTPMSIADFKKLCSFELERARKAKNEPPSRVRVLEEALQIATDLGEWLGC